ncbi:hypothetical protein HORIV_70520 [Vreelandella olivaria]|uniref:Uncharacterized protein n=1 Tax=Vreelandella olivaria TaxID=390919 RepID=A0ABM7GU67_9GAMM|nr:hypothetical protein HORIV_70520 [Halomonas olivaria]
MKLSLKSTIIGTGASLLASTAMAQNLTLQSAFPFSLEVIDTSIHRFVEDVATATNGELTFTPYDAGSFSPPFEILENVGNGSLDAGWSAASYWAGQIPAAALFQKLPSAPMCRSTCPGCMAVAVSNCGRRCTLPIMSCRFPAAA